MDNGRGVGRKDGRMAGKRWKQWQKGGGLDGEQGSNGGEEGEKGGVRKRRDQSPVGEISSPRSFLKVGAYALFPSLSTSPLIRHYNELRRGYRPIARPCMSVCPSVRRPCIQDYVSAISPVSIDGFSPKFCHWCRRKGALNTALASVLWENRYGFQSIN